MQTSNLHPNVKILRSFAMLREMLFIAPVIVMFAQWRGVTFAQFMAIQAMFSVVMILADPLISPLADKYGRKPAILLGALFWTLGHVIIWLGNGWQSYAAAEVMLGLGIAAYRPAAEALLYDSLASVNREDAHYNALTQQNYLQSYAGGAAMFCGGWLFLMHPATPAAVTVLANILMLFVVLRLTEAPYHTHIADKAPTYRGMWKQVWVSLSAPSIRWLVVLPGLISGSTITLFWSVQPSFAQQGVGAGLLSLLLGSYFVMRGLFARHCARLASRFTGRQCFAMCIAALGVGYVSMALLPWYLAYLPFIVGSGFAYILSDTLGRELVHRHVASSVRSTAIGGFQMVGRVIATSTLLSCSLLQPLVGLPATLLIIGIPAMILTSASLTRLPRETDKPTARHAA